MRRSAPRFASAGSAGQGHSELSTRFCSPIGKKPIEAEAKFVLMHRLLYLPRSLAAEMGMNEFERSPTWGKS